MADEAWDPVLDWLGVAEDGAGSVALNLEVYVNGDRVRIVAASGDSNADPVSVYERPRADPVGPLLDDMAAAVAAGGAGGTRFDLIGIASSPALSLHPVSLTMDLAPDPQDGLRHARMQLLGGSRRVARFAWDATASIDGWFNELRRAFAWCRG